jgi:hypothetical protein
MPYFIPSDPNAGEVICYNEEMCSVDNPVFLEGRRADKAMANPDFTDVIEAKPVKKTRKKKVSKK